MPRKSRGASFFVFALCCFSVHSGNDAYKNVGKFYNALIIISNNVIYKNEPRIAVGKVAQVSGQYSQQFNFQQPINLNNMGMLVDIAIEVDGKTEPFPRIPINSTIAEFPEKGVVISETREGMLNEINVIRGASQTAIDQVDIHKRIIASCDQLLFELNPQLKHEQEQAGKIARLEEQLAGMSEQIAALTGMLSKSLVSKKTKEE